MEEILASIRRIIADDQEVAKAPPAPKPAPPAPAPAAPPRTPEPLEEDVLELADVAQPVKLTTRPPVGQAFNMLAHTVLSSNARTLEDLVREMLRPMLKNWLDDNLPTIVERLIRAEIERVARGGR
jgi:cell pole-organizing protein PopZ